MLVNSTCTSNSNCNVKIEPSCKQDGSSSNLRHLLSHQQSKRLSIIDRGKSWAKQLIKSNRLSNSPSLTAHKSFDSCDSGIDTNSYSSNCSKISTSSSCSFIASYISNSSDIASKSSNSSSISSNNSDTYDVYSSPSKTSSSAYLISPIDESGYLVPIVNFPINNISDSKTKTRSTFNNNSHLTRSFSTRSAYASSNQNQSYRRFNPNNRATICEQISTESGRFEGLYVDHCVKCNSKLEIVNRKNGSMLSFYNKPEEDCIKTNQAYSLFDSFTCVTCLSASTATPGATVTNNNLKVPQDPAPSPPTQLHISDSPPPLPSQPPPSLLNYTSSNIKITPLLICTDKHNQIVLKENTNNCNCSFCIHNFDYLSSTLTNKPATNCIDCIRLSLNLNSNNIKIRSSTPEIESDFVEKYTNSSINKRSKEEPIAYIDSQEESYDTKTMNHILNKIRQRNSSLDTSTANRNCNCNCNCKNSPTDIIKNNFKQKLLNKHDIQHDYHLIDDENTTFLTGSKKLKNFLTPSNSVESFEFINLNAKSKHDISSSDCKTEIVSYEKCWENSTIILLNNLQQKLNNTSQTRTNPRPVNCCSMREKRSSLLLHNGQRYSFLMEPVEVENNSNNLIIDDQSSKTSNDNSSLKIASSKCSINNCNHKTNDKQQLFLLENGDDIERLLSGSSNEQENVSFKNSLSSSDSDLSVDLESINEYWYQPNMPRENVPSYLIDKEIGSFLVRLSNSCKNCYALSIRVPYFANPNGIAHYLITRNTKGYKLKGVEKEFKSLKSLVTHYSVMQEILPVTLSLSNSQIQSCNSKLNVITNKNCVLSNQINNQKFMQQHHHHHQHLNISNKNTTCLIK